ncbi:MAG: serine/threonine protein kinase [Sandaracinaceae bacterium]|nr:serine/threonine protein kinase [Sandaracinaceae bacterium]
MAEQRYRVVERLAAGGMAEVFVGDAMSVQGFKKRVAIKRVLPHLASNENFIGMFLDEARLGARMNHANIVSVLDIGAADNTYFIVMEYVDGANLKTIIEVLLKQGRPVPMKEAVYIAMEACRGLSYAHELCDDDGNDLDIVHRDISPPNILISKRGEVKVTDFGLAKASTQLEKTDPGVVKGKFSYLAPEAALGDAVDERADLFAMGIVLWEMIAGKRLFLGDSDYQTVKLVQQANVPKLSSVNPEADDSLERVLAKALAKHPADRYQTAREMSDALAGFLFSHQMKVTSYDIAALVKNAVENEDKPRGAAGQQSIIDKLIQEELVRFTSLGSDGVTHGHAPSSDSDDGGAKPLDAGSFEDPSSWFSDDGDAGLGFGDGAGANSGGAQPGWRESGVDEGIAKLESQSVNLGAAAGTPTPASKPSGKAGATPAAGPGTPTGAGAAGAAGTPTPASTQTTTSGGGGGKWLVVGLVLLVVGGAVAFLLTQS